jgi:hypothetical protein
MQVKHRRSEETSMDQKMREIRAEDINPRLQLGAGCQPWAP